MRRGIVTAVSNYAARCLPAARESTRRLARPRFLLLAAAVLAPQAVGAQWAQVTMISPTNNQHFTSSSVSISFAGCSTVTPTTALVYLNSTTLSTTSTTTGCQDWTVRKRYSATGTLTPGANSVQAELCHSQQSPPCIYSSIITVYLDVPDIGVSPHTATDQIGEGNASQELFTVTNTGGTTDTAKFTISCGSALTSCTRSPTKAYLTPNQSVTVTLAYTGANPGTSRATLRAAYASTPTVIRDSGYTTVLVQSQWADVDLISPTNNQHFTSSSVAISFSGCSTVTPSSALAYVGGTSYSTTSTTTGCQDWTIRKRYSATGTLTPGANSIQGELCHSQLSPPCISSSPRTVYYDTPAIVVSPHSTIDQIGDGNVGQTVFKVKNTGQIQDTANFTAICTGTVTSCTRSPTKKLLPVGDSTNVTLSYTGSSAGSGTAKLRAVYNLGATTKDSGIVTVDVESQWAAVAMISPTNNQHFTSPSVAISFSGCSTATPTSALAYVGGNAYSTTNTTTGCQDWTIRKRYSATGTMTSGANTIQGELCSSTLSPPCISSSPITVYYDTPAIAVSPHTTTSEIVNTRGLDTWFTAIAINQELVTSGMSAS